MSLSTSEIQVIHQQAIAVAGRRYVDINGSTYIGTSTGRLRLIDENIPLFETAIASLQDQAQDVVEAVAAITTPAVTEEDSYFEIDVATSYLVPKEIISSVILGNAYSLDLLAGYIVPSTNTDNTDTFFEFDLSNYLIPKAL